MVQPVFPTDGMAATPGRPSRVASAIVTAAVMLVVLLLVGAGTLWAHYGTAVFFEMVKSGIAACI